MKKQPTPTASDEAYAHIRLLARLRDLGAVIKALCKERSSATPLALSIVRSHLRGVQTHLDAACAAVEKLTLEKFCTPTKEQHA